MDSHAQEEPPARNTHVAPVLKQYFVPMSSQSSNVEGLKEMDRPSAGALPFPVNKVVAYLLKEMQRNKNMHGGQQQHICKYVTEQKIFR